MDRYQRFEVCSLPGRKEPVGLFRALIHLDDGGLLQPGLRDSLRRSSEWFNSWLGVPPQISFKSRSEWRDGKCWFNARARWHMPRIWEMAWALKSCDVPVRLMETEDPGLITYEDQAQVVAIPRRSTRWKSRII